MNGGISVVQRSSKTEIDVNMHELDSGEMAFFLCLLGKGSHCGHLLCGGPR